MNNIKKFNLLEKIKNNKKYQIILIVIIFLIVLGVSLSGTFTQKTAQNTSQTDQQSFVSSLEERLEKTLSKVSGAGDVSVVITVESGMETILAMKTETIENSNGKQIIETPILVNGKTVVIKEKFPKITGVLIVCEGANNIAVLTKIQQATLSLLDININQIEILSMK